MESGANSLTKSGGVVKILVTGATGNVGRELLAQLEKTEHTVVAAARDKRCQSDHPKQAFVDLARGIGPEQSFDAIFLMRPPQLADPEPFRRFLDRYDRSTRIVFLSVQGADSRSYLPHAKIEALIRDMGFDHCFIRPSYFMENLLTTLAPDLKENGRIYLPAGNLTLDWVSVSDIAACAMAALTRQTDRKALTVTSGRLLGFAEVLTIVNAAAVTEFRYVPASLLGYILHERRNGSAWSFIAVMLLLHFLPRFGRPIEDSGDIQSTLSRRPESLEHWAERNADAFRQLAASG